MTRPTSRAPAGLDRYAPVPTGEPLALAALLGDGRLSGGSPAVTDYEHDLTRWFGVNYAVAVNSGTSALHAALHAVGATPGTEIIGPATAPPATAMPILTAGGTPVIVDVRRGALGLDLDDLQRVITDKTRAVISLPLWGYPTGDKDAAALLAQAGIPLIEDAAQAHGTRDAGELAGTIGGLGCFSTHDRKLLSTGEGGFVLTNNPELHQRIESWTRLGHLDGATHGVNYKLAAPLAVIGHHRLAHLAGQLATRRANAQRLLAALPADGVIRELGVPPGGSPNQYTLVLTADTPNPRFAEGLQSAGIAQDSRQYGYRPLYQRPLFARYSRPCPHAEVLAASTYQLPTHPGLSPAALDWIAAHLADLAQGARP